MTKDEQVKEVARCLKSPAYFICEYVRIYDALTGDWIPFQLWPEQRAVLESLEKDRLNIILKARQLGLTWLVLAFALWLMLFQPAATILLFSRRDTESIHLLDDRLKGMYQRLPHFLKVGLEVVEDSAHEWQLSTESVARAFPTSAGDSYTATLAIVDEADLLPDLGKLMRAVKPTIDNGGRMILLSRADKTRPESEFKKIYRAAKRRINNWAATFLPWDVHPRRDDAWYQAQKADILARTGALDDLHEQYPATDTEALAPRTLDKRIPAPWLEKQYEELERLEPLPPGCPSIPGLEVYTTPRKGEKYAIGVDPAEGNPTSDDSSLTVLDNDGEEVAALSGKFQPSTLAAYADKLGHYYNRAPVMVERNNHGHAVILWLKDNSKLQLLKGHDGKVGWHSTTKGKAILYDMAADAFRDEETTLHSFETYVQLASINGSTLRAPEGQFDDRADSYSLAIVGLRYRPPAPRKAKSFQG